VIVKIGRRLAEIESVRFLVIGGFNTLFGIVDSFVMVKLALLIVPSQPKTMGTVAIAVSSVINIGVSFLTYKWFVFRTKGNYLKEYLRSLLIYLPNLAASTLAVAPLATILRRWIGHEKGSVYAAIAIIVVAGIVFSFFGHKNVTFRQTDGAEESGR
jgi:putative flippase GtrA